MKVQLLKGSTSNILQIFIADSSSTTGAGLTGLTNASSGLTAYYHRDTDTTATAISLASMTVGTFTSSGFKEIDATNMPGWYQFCPPNAAVASGAASCAFHLKGATNMAPLPIEVELVAYNPQDSVRLGLTALPNAAAEAAGGLYTRGSGAGQINQPANGQIDANAVKLGGTTQTGRDIGASVLLSSGTGTGQLDFTSGVVKSSLVQILGTALTETAGQIAAAFKQFFDVASPTGTMKAITNVVTVTNLTNAPTSGDFTSTMKTSLNAATPAVTVSDKTGFSLSAAGVQAIWDALTSALTTVGSIGKRLVDNLTGDIYARLGAPAGASVSADIAAAKSDTAAIKAKTDNLPASPAAVGSAMTLANNSVTAAALAADAGAEIADAVWDEAQSGHTTAGTFGKYLDTEVSGISGGGGSSPTAAQIADAVWDEKVDDHTSDRSFGFKVGLHLPVVTPDIDYKRIRKVVNEEIKSIPASKEPEQVDLEPISVALQSIVQEIRDLPKPEKPEKVNLEPVLSRLEAVQNEVRSIEIPETDLKPVMDKLADCMTMIEPYMNGMAAETEALFNRIKDFFNGDMEKMQKGIQGLSDKFNSIPYVMLNQPKDEQKPSAVEEYLKL